jgi:ubiquinone/menaquinone biosynthesis C-methylase UbiE
MINMKKTWQQQWNVVYGVNKDPNREFLLFPLLLKTSLPIKGKSIIDLGCGNGSLIVKLLKYKPKEIYGLDSNDQFLKFAKNNISDKRVRFLKSDIRRRLPIRSRHFDMAYCTFVFNETNNLDSILKEVSRVLKRKGRFYLMTTHPFFPLNYFLYEKFTGKRNNKIRNVKGYFRNYKGGYILTMARRTTPFYNHRVEELINLMVKNGLIIREVRELSTNSKLLKACPIYAQLKDIPRVILISAEKA